MVPITWDLLIGMFIIVSLSYSFIIGPDGTIKVILASYIAVLAANAIGNLISSQVLLANNPYMLMLGTSPEDNVVIVKILIFILATLFIVLKGGFEITLAESSSFMIRFVTTLVYGLLSSGLIITILLSFITGNGADGLLSGILVENPINLEGKAAVFNLLIANHNIWFSLPIGVFLLHSMVRRSDEFQQ